MQFNARYHLITGIQPNQLTYYMYNDTKSMTLNSLTLKAKENPQLIYGGPSQSQTATTHPQMKITPVLSVSLRGDRPLFN